MRTEQLQYLLAAAQCGSINKASEKLYVSQQSLNISLKKLESEVGHTLLIRNAQGVVLSEAGQLLANVAEEVIELLAECSRQMDHLTDDQQVGLLKDSLMILISPLINLNFMPTLIKSFAAQYPAVKLKTMEMESMEIVSYIRTHKSALGLMVFLEGVPMPSSMTLDEDMIYERLFCDKLYAVLSQNHPLAKQKSVSVKTLLKYPLAVYQSGNEINNPVMELLMTKGASEVYLTTDNIRVYEQAISAGNVVGFFPKSGGNLHFFSKEIAEDLTYLLIKDFPPIQVYYFLDHAYYQAHQQVIVAFLNIFKALI